MPCSQNFCLRTWGFWEQPPCRLARMSDSVRTKIRLVLSRISVKKGVRMNSPDSSNFPPSTLSNWRTIGICPKTLKTREMEGRRAHLPSSVQLPVLVQDQNLGVLEANSLDNVDRILPLWVRA